VLTLALALALTQTPQHWLFRQPNLPRAGLAYFELAPQSGEGMTGVCNTTAPTGAKGEALTFTRATTATCTKGGAGLRTTGIADGDLVSMSSGVARQMFDENGWLKWLIEGQAATNLLLRYIAIDNAAWSDVGTPTLTTGLADPFGGTAAVSIDDNDGAAFEGRSQTVTVSAGAAYTMHCYVKAGTRAEARITLDGTAATITSLSSSTWSIISVTDASTSGTSVAAQVLSGDATGDTGTVIFGGCQVESGDYFTSSIPTAGTTATRNAETLTVAPDLSTVASTGCSSIEVTPLHTSLTGGLLMMNNAGRPLYAVTTNMRVYDGTTELSVAHGFARGVTKRYRSTWTGSALTVFNVTAGTSTGGAYDGTMNTTGPLAIGASAVIGLTASWLVGGVVLDPSTGRCP